MTIPYSPKAIADIFKLSGLKNVSKRKVMPEEEILAEDEQPEGDVSGTAINTQQMRDNVPEPDLGGELSAQSYDVRANKEIAVPGEEEGNMFTKLGAALAKNMQQKGMYRQGLTPPVAPETPPIETQQVDMQEGLPPVSASQEEAAQERQKAREREFEKAKYMASPAWKNFVNKVTPAQILAKAEKEIPESFERINPETQVLEKHVRQKPKELEHEEMNRAMENPMQVAVYGATDQVANNPELVNQFQEITGIDFSPETQNLTDQYERIASDIEKGNNDLTGYDEQARRIHERIVNNQSTEMDKYYIGLALLMPLIVGGLFGKEAGLGALGGAAQGISGNYERRANENLKNEELLAEINKQRGVIESKRQENLSKLSKENEFLEAGRTFARIDPKTGQRELYKEIEPGFVAPVKNLKDKEDLKRYQKKADELIPKKSATEEINGLISNIIEIESLMKKRSWYNPKKIWAAASSKIIPSTIPDYEIEFEGRNQNATTLLRNQIGFLVDAYRKAEKLGQLDAATERHTGQIFSDPSKSFTNAKDSIDQLLMTRKYVQNGYLTALKNNGFSPDFSEEEFGKSNQKVYKGLNTKIEEKEAKNLRGKT